MPITHCKSNMQISIGIPNDYIVFLSVWLGHYWSAKAFIRWTSLLVALLICLHICILCVRLVAPFQFQLTLTLVKIDGILVLPFLQWFIPYSEVCLSLTTDLQSHGRKKCIPKIVWLLQYGKGTSLPPLFTQNWHQTPDGKPFYFHTMSSICSVVDVNSEAYMLCLCSCTGIVSSWTWTKNPMQRLSLRYHYHHLQETQKTCQRISRLICPFLSKSRNEDGQRIEDRKMKKLTIFFTIYI